MRSELFSAENLEKESAQPGLRLQNSKLLKAELNGEFMARVGSMVAYQGQVQFEALGSGGIGKFLKQKLTGEGVPLMKVTRPAATSSSPRTPPTSTSSTWSRATPSPSTAPTCWPSTRP